MKTTRNIILLKTSTGLKESLRHTLGVANRKLIALLEILPLIDNCSMLLDLCD